MKELIMKTLFDKDFKLNLKDGAQLHSKTYRLLEQLFDEYVQKGYSPREIAHIMQGAITEKELYTVL